MSEKAWKNLRVSALLRQEWANDQQVPFTWSVGTQYKSPKWGLIRAHLSKNFNMPTLNDRYWATLGNPDLLAEDGYSSSAGWEIGNKRIGTQITVFQLILDNWILWQPGNDGRFRPNNLRKVRSRGFEWRGHFAYASGLWHWEIKGFYQYLKATNERAYPGAENAVGKQLPYTPNHQASTTLTVQYRSVALAYLQQFTGRRFTTTDNSDQVDGFFVATLLTQWTPTLPARSGLHPSLGIKVDNLWNRAYQLLAYRPLPGRNWQLNVAFRF
jgi:iron complex outermembrane receptor protein